MGIGRWLAMEVEQAKKESVVKRRAKKIETTANDKELAKLSVAKAKKSAGSTTTVKAHNRKGSDGVKSHTRKMTASEKRAATAKELLKQQGDNFAQQFTELYVKEHSRPNSFGVVRKKELFALYESKYGSCPDIEKKFYQMRVDGLFGTSKGEKDDLIHRYE